MRGTRSWHILLTVFTLMALLAPMAPADVRTAEAASALRSAVPGGNPDSVIDYFIKITTPTPVAATPTAPRPIIVGRMTGANTPAPATPVVGPLTFTGELSERGLPLAPKSEFPAGTQVVYAFFDYDGFVQGREFEQVWYVDGTEMGRDRWAWDRAEKGTYQGGFNNPDGLFPGSYRLDILLDGQLLGFGGFVVAVPPPAVATEPLAATPAFGPITFAESAEMAPRTEFPAGTQAIYAIFDYSGMATDAELSATLYMGDKKVMSQSSLWDLGASGQAASVKLSNDRGYRAGAYRVVLSVNGADVQSGVFQVATAPSPIMTVAATPTAVPPPTAMPTPTPPPPTAVAAAPTLRPTPRPALKPLPAKIVYTRVDNNTHSIWVMNLDGSEQRKLADYASDPSWSPDGSRIVYFGYDAAPRGRGIYQMKLDGTGVELIWNEGTAQYLDWSPAGAFVAMDALNSVVVYDGKAGTWRTISKGEQPSFSPDGRQIVAKSCIGGSCGLFIMNRDGSNSRRVTMSAEDAMPAWSPAGKRIAYATQRDGNWDIYTMNLDGSDQTRLTDDPGIDAMPVWLPDGSGIAFRSTRGGVWGIWVMNPDGSEPRKIADAPAADDWGRSRFDVR